MSEGRQQAIEREEESSKNVQLVKQQKQEEKKQTSQLISTKIGTKVGQEHTNVYDAQAGLVGFLKNTNQINTTQARNIKTIQENQINQIVTEFNEVSKNKDQYSKSSFEKYTKEVNNYLKDASKNLDNIKKAIEKGETNKTVYKNIIKQLEEKSIKPHLKQQIKYKTSPKGLKQLKEKKEILESGKIKGVTTKPKQVVGRRSALNRGIQYDDLIQRFYDKGNFPTQEEVLEANKKYGLAAKEKFKAGSVGEALNRLVYAALETGGGAMREATIGLTGSMGVENRPGGSLYQVAGGLVTPTALDYAAGYALSKLAIRKNGRRIIQKINDYFYPEKMWANPQMAAKVAKAFESTGGMGLPTTTDVRNAQRLLTNLDLTQAKPFISSGEFSTLKRMTDLAEKNKIDELEKFLTSTLETTGKKSAKYFDVEKVRAAQRPVNYWMVYQRATQKLTKELTIKPRKFVPLDQILTPAEYKLYRETFIEHGINWDKARYYSSSKLKELAELNLKILRTTPESGGMAVPDYVFMDRTIRELGWDPDEYFDMIKKYKIDPDIAVSIFFNLTPKDREKMLKEMGFKINKPIPGITTLPISELSPSEIDELAKDMNIDPALLVIPLPDITPAQSDTTTQDTEEAETLKQELALIPPLPSPEPPPPVDTPGPLPPTPLLQLSDEDKKKRREMNLSLFRGRVMLYRVNYQYRGDKTETIGPLEARSLPDALGKAQRRRRPNKTLPRVIDVVLIGERK